MVNDTSVCTKPISSDTIQGISLESAKVPLGEAYQTFPNSFVKTIEQIEIGKIRKKEVPSIFKTHLLQTDSINRIIPSRAHNDWITLILFSIVILFIWVKSTHSKRIRQIFDGISAVRYISQQSREGWIFSHNGSLEMFLIFVMSVSMVTFLIIDENMNHTNNYKLYAQISGGILLTYVFKLLLFKFIGNLLNLKKEINEYVTQVFSLNEFLGMILLPVSILIAYVEILKNPFSFIALIIIALTYAFRIFRGVIIISTYSKFSKFYLFLYFCILEILPMLVLIKFLTNIF